jgi:hypothetical protein
VWICEKRQKEVTKQLWVILSGAFTYLELIIVQMNLTGAAPLGVLLLSSANPSGCQGRE